MNIKSYSGNLFLENIFNSIKSFFKKTYTKWILVALLSVSTYALWEHYSGLLSVWLAFNTYVYAHHGDSSLGIDDFIPFFILGMITLFPVAIMGSMNVYDGSVTEKEMVIENYEFVNFNNTLVINISAPTKRVLVFNDMNAYDYHTLKQYNGSQMTGYISKSERYDHIDKLFYDSQTDEYNFDIHFTIGKKSYTVECYCEGKKNSKDCSCGDCPNLFENK